MATKATGLFLVLVVAFSPQLATAEFKTGQDLQEGLQKWFKDPTPDGDLIEASVAFGYVVGVVDAHTDITVCPPDGATQGQLAQIAFKYLNANPEKLNLSADLLVVNSLRVVWPCKKS
jgi:hypothetical protein